MVTLSALTISQPLFVRKATEMIISIVRSARRWIAYAAAIAAAGLPLSTLSAFAADMLVQPRAPAVERPLWTGFYIGLHGGGGWGRSRLQDPNFALTYLPVFINSSGWLVGGQLGANWQFGNVVVGGELDASGSLINGRTDPDPNFFLSGFSAGFRALATGTGRVGYAAGQFLGYAKAGLAWANIDLQSGLGVTPPQPPIDVNHQRTGLTAGAGLEMALVGNLSARLEYDFIYFGPASISLGGQSFGAQPDLSNVSHQLHLMTVGLNWRFRDE
jgi:outer membrane immunogenic protein